MAKKKKKTGKQAKRKASGVTMGSVKPKKRKPRRRGPAKTGKQAIETVEKYVKVLELRKKGLTLQEIAKKLGYSHPSGAHQALTRALQRKIAEPAEDVRALEMLRLDSLFKRAWSKIEKGAPLAGQNGMGAFILRLMDRRAKLLGLDAPEKMEASVKNEGLDYSRMDGSQIQAELMKLWHELPAELRETLKGAEDAQVENQGDAGDGSRPGGRQLPEKPDS